MDVFRSELLGLVSFIQINAYLHGDLVTDVIRPGDAVGLLCAFLEVFRAEAGGPSHVPVVNVGPHVVVQRARRSVTYPEVQCLGLEHSPDLGLVVPVAYSLANLSGPEHRRGGSILAGILPARPLQYPVPEALVLARQVLVPVVVGSDGPDDLGIRILGHLAVDVLQGYCVVVLALVSRVIACSGWQAWWRRARAMLVW